MATFYFDGDKLQQCPYQPNHRVLSKRMLAHITKCAACSPKLLQCSFNTLHRVYPDEFNTHIMEYCDNRQVIREILNPVVQPPTLVTPQPQTVNIEDPWENDAMAKEYLLPGLEDDDYDKEIDCDCYISQKNYTE